MAKKKRAARKPAARKPGFIAGAAVGAVVAYLLLRNNRPPMPPTLPPQLPTGPAQNTTVPGTALAQLPRGAFRPIGTALYV